MIISNAMNTKTNSYARLDDQTREAGNEYMAQWDQQNQTGYASAREFQDADANAYWSHTSKRKKAYDDWLAGQQQAPSQPQTPQTSPGQQVQQTNPSPAAQQSNTGATMASPGIIANTMSAAQQQQQAAQAAQAQTQQQSGGQVTQNVGNNVDAEGQITQTQGYQAAQLGDAKQWGITSEQTMAGQMNGLIAKNSPHIQLAEMRARERANEMGLVNSSMAVTAGQMAAYDAAMPIAQNDANTHAKAAGYNADIANQFSMQNVGWQNEAGKFSADAANQAGIHNAGNKTSLITNRERNETSKWTSQLDADVRREDIGMRKELGKEDIGLRRELGHLDASVRREDIGVRRELGYLDAETRTNIAQMDNATRKELGYLDANTRTNIAQMDNETQLRVVEMEGEYRNLLQTNANAAEYFRQMSVNINSIESANLSVQSKKYAIDRQEMMARDAMRVFQQLGNVSGLNTYYNYA